LIHLTVIARNELAIQRVWYYMPVSPALRSLSQKGCEFQASLGYRARPSLKQLTDKYPSKV
jgi:hypothetical protein